MNWVCNSRYVYVLRHVHVEQHMAQGISIVELVLILQNGRLVTAPVVYLRRATRVWSCIKVKHVIMCTIRRILTFQQEAVLTLLYTLEAATANAVTGTYLP